jgi:hypothetical protein
MTVISVLIIVLLIVVMNDVYIIVAVLILNEKLWRVIEILINRLEIIDILKVDDFRFVIIKERRGMLCFIGSAGLKNSRLSLKWVLYLWSAVNIPIPHRLRNLIIIIIIIIIISIIYLNIVVINVVVVRVYLVVKDNIIIVSISINLLTLMLDMHVVSNAE